MTAWLLTWISQGTAIALGVAVAMRYAPRRNAATRHLIWCAALVAVAWHGWASFPHSSPSAFHATGADPIYIPPAPDFLISVFVGVWAAIALMSLVRILPALRGVYAARDRCRPFPAALACRLPLWLAARGSGRRAELMLCDAVPGATVLGFYRPYIAIPPALVGILRIDELDQAILHEYAHVRRRDDWCRLVQALFMSALWIHPAALFASRALSREREMACDEWVIARTGNPKGYAQCLAHAAEAGIRMKSEGRPLVPALLGSRHDLTRRVDRVLGMGDHARQRVSVATLVSAVCAMTIASVQMQGVQVAEIAAIVFPVDRVQELRWAQGVQEVRGVQGVQEVPEVPEVQGVRRVQEVQRSSPHASVGPPAPIARHAPVAPLASLAPIAPSSPIAPVSTVYALPQPAAFALSGEPARWRAITEPGREIASAATGTAKRVAAGVTRAGVSLARRF